MNRYRQIFHSLLFGAVTSLNLGAAQATTLDIANTPLFLGGLVQPNIMFTLDDSGSMQWEMMPDSLIWSYFVFPRADGVYGGSDYPTYTVSFNTTNNIYGIWVRSHDVNRIYYNPKVTYRPWIDTDGTLMDDASITCAPHNPYDTDVGCRNLTQNNTATVRWEYYDGTLANFPSGASSPGNDTQTFWPAVYYTLNEDGDRNDPDDFTRVEIRSSRSTYPKDAGRTDCGDDTSTSCTYAQEIQNFANWYTYYRSRILLARAGVGKAFSEQGTEIRVGFSSINYGSDTIDGVSSSGSVIKGVRAFAGQDRVDFFDALYGHVMPAQGTPLRRALDNVGKYFQRTDNRGPWGNTPGTDDTSDHLTCRQSYNILMTDGYWNGDAAATSGATNADDVEGPVITGPDPDGSGTLTYQYEPANPYQDGFSNTLADVAMYYWNRDLRTDLVNKVPTNPADEAFWQHLVNFTVGLGVTGTLDPATDLPALTDGTLSWPQAVSDGGEPNVDDLWHAAVNSRGGFFSAGNPRTFSRALSNSLASIAERIGSSAAIATNSARLNSSTYIYQARFNSADWHGELLAFKIDEDTGEVLAPDPLLWSSTKKRDTDSGNWEAGALLMDMQPGDRKLFSYNPESSSGIPFAWDSLSAAQQAALNHGDGLGPDRLDYITGVQSKETSQRGGVFRSRTTVLGDIVDSDPWFVGGEDYGYSTLPGAEGSAYVEYRLGSTYQNRPGVVYVGANDGMLHGFDAVSGEERFAYIPGNGIENLWQLTEPEYSHRYFVNASPKSGDVYIGSSWKTYLVGTTGAGGKTVFALDVSDPADFDETDVVWEFTPADDVDEDGVAQNDLGYTMGQASIVRLANGSWAAVFGNGYASGNQHAVLFIVDISDGSIIAKIDTGAGDSTTPNGLSTPLAVDFNSDGITDRIYAGDLLGNLWDFDVSNINPSQWGSRYLQGTDPVPLFVARDGDGTRQPITAKPEARLHPQGGVIVYFGTGKYFEVGDSSTSSHNTFYAIRDFGAVVSERADLLEQKITHEVNETFTDADNNTYSWELRVTTKHEVDWSTQEGWYMDLALQDDSDGDGTTAPPAWDGERVISAPLLRNDRVIFTTMIPDPNPCASGGTGWLMELSSLDGARLDQSPFDLNNSGTFDEDDYVTVTIPGSPEGDGEPQTIAIPVSGKKTLDITKTPAVVRKPKTNKEYKYSSGSSGKIEKTLESAGYFTDRQSWRQLR